MRKINLRFDVHGVSKDTTRLVTIGMQFWHALVASSLVSLIWEFHIHCTHDLKVTTLCDTDQELKNRQSLLQIMYLYDLIVLLQEARLGWMTPRLYNVYACLFDKCRKNTQSCLLANHMKLKEKQFAIIIWLTRELKYQITGYISIRVPYPDIINIRTNPPRINH